MHRAAHCLLPSPAVPDSTALLLRACRPADRAPPEPCCLHRGSRHQDRSARSCRRRFRGRALRSSMPSRFKWSRIPMGGMRRTGQGRRAGASKSWRVKCATGCSGRRRQPRMRATSPWATRRMTWWKRSSMRVLQGSDPDGLRGIPLRRGPYVRPLLRCTREQVVEYLGIPWPGVARRSHESGYGFPAKPGAAPPGACLEERVPGLCDRSAESLEEARPYERSGTRTGLAPALASDEYAAFRSRQRSFFAAPVAVRAASLLLLYDRFRGARFSATAPLALPCSCAG